MRFNDRVMHRSGSPRHEMMWWGRQLWRARATWSLLLLLAGIQLAIWLAGGVDAQWGCYETFGLSRDGVADGKIWQLLTHAMLHGSWAHLAWNGLLLLWLGARMESIAGAASALGVMVAGAMAGGLAHLAVSPGILAGSSGAAFALLFCYATLSPDSRLLMPFKMRARHLALGMLVAELGLMLADPAHALPVFSSLGQGLSDRGMQAVFRISHGCHLGGAAAGWLIACWMLRPRVTLESLQRERARREE